MVCFHGLINIQQTISWLNKTILMMNSTGLLLTGSESVGEKNTKQNKVFSLNLI